MKYCSAWYGSQPLLSIWKRPACRSRTVVGRCFPTTRAWRSQRRTGWGSGSRSASVTVAGAGGAGIGKQGVDLARDLPFQYDAADAGGGPTEPDQPDQCSTDDDHQLPHPFSLRGAGRSRQDDTVT